MSHHKRTRVFVYGTLLTGQPNHYLLDDQDLAATATTEPAFTLVNLGRFPAMCEGGDTAVLGELYDVGPATLVALDRLEGHPSFYHRAPITLTDGSKVIAYLLPRARALAYPQIHDGDWRRASEEQSP